MALLQVLLVGERGRWRPLPTRGPTVVRMEALLDDPGLWQVRHRFVLLREDDEALCLR